MALLQSSVDKTSIYRSSKTLNQEEKYHFYDQDIDSEK